MSPRLRLGIVSVAALLALLATVSLGRWQLARAAYKESLYAAMQAQQARPAVTQAALREGGVTAELLHRSVRLRGHWLSQRTVFLDNRPMHEQTGLYVLTPLQLAGGAGVVLVQRGWVARNFLDRTALPWIDTPAGEVEVEGRMAPPPGKLYAFAGPDTGAIRQNLDLAAFRAETGLALFPLSVQQTGPAQGLLQRDWPAVNLGVEKHYGYAFQWFGLSALIVLLYVWFQIVRRFFRPRPPRAPQP